MKRRPYSIIFAILALLVLSPACIASPSQIHDEASLEFTWGFHDSVLETLGRWVSELSSPWLAVWENVDAHLSESFDDGELDGSEPPVIDGPTAEIGPGMVPIG